MTNRAFKSIPFVMLFLAITFSCSEKEETIDDQTNIKNNPVITTGKLHNEGLAYVYEKSLLNQHYDSDSDMNEQVIQDGLTFLHSNNEIINSNVIDEMFVSHYNGTEETVISEPLQIELQKLIDYVDQAITETNENGDQEIFEYSQSIINTPPEHLDEFEKLAWQHAVDVMGYSTKYWYEYYGDWKAETNLKGEFSIVSKGPKKGWWKKFWKKVKKVVVADFIGAAEGAVDGFIRGGNRSEVLSSALATGVGSSIGAAIKN
ncbi:hypothetical protein [Aquimarina algiphila]|uniref:Lipoprotein n=1 Tax=Aquimarina algiphila TaxID=2047982 RepID=A0A554VJC3_9FLAO|nr:hypothetical protein [Aquimarina algiphila]TSE07987.1 hypothetical protein FOF46_13885 [Aquimarina algiphila]